MKGAKFLEWMTSAELSSSDENCYEIQLAKTDCEAFHLDNASILLEVRASSDLYGVFYTAKGLQWDVWSDAAQEGNRQGIAYAKRNPVQAACELLSYHLRPDFKYDPEENAE